MAGSTRIRYFAASTQGKYGSIRLKHFMAQLLRLRLRLPGLTGREQRRPQKGGREQCSYTLHISSVYISVAVLPLCLYFLANKRCHISVGAARYEINNRRGCWHSQDAERPFSLSINFSNYYTRLVFPIPSLNPTVINRKLVCSINIWDILNSEELLF